MPVPIKIYKNGELLSYCKTIQETARVLQADTGDKNKRFNAIERGYCLGEQFSVKGNVYRFVASEEDSKRRREQLIAKGSL